MEDKYEYQAQWLKLKGMHREIKMMCLGAAGDKLYVDDMQKIINALEVSMEELKKRIEE